MREAKIRHLHNRYNGSSTWFLLYQAAVRARNEQLERTYIELKAAHIIAQNKGCTTNFDPNHPWNEALRAVIQLDQFWGDDFREPGMMIISRLAALSSTLDGDAQVQQRLPADFVYQAPLVEQGSPGNIKGPKPKGPKPAKAKSVQQLGGLLTHNRKGRALCQDYQTCMCTHMNQAGRLTARVASMQSVSQ